MALCHYVKRDIDTSSRRQRGAAGKMRQCARVLVVRFLKFTLGVFVCRVYSAHSTIPDSTGPPHRSQRTEIGVVKCLVNVFQKYPFAIMELDLGSIGARLAAESHQTKSAFDGFVPDGLLFQKRATLERLLRLVSAGPAELGSALLKPGMITESAVEVLVRFRDVCVQAMNGGWLW